MGENCMFITLPAKLKKNKNILNTYTTLIVKASFGKNNFELSTC